MSRSSTCLAVLVLAALLSAGCITRAARESVGLVTGASSRHVTIQPLTQDALLPYGQFDVELFTTRLGPALPGNFAYLCKAETMAAVAKEATFTGSGRKLIIKGEVVHYESDSTFDKVIGPLQEAIARVSLVDAQSGKTIAVANVIGRAKSSSASGERKLAEAVAKGIGEWIGKTQKGKE